VDLLRFDSTLLHDEIAIDPSGTFFACVGDAFGQGTTTENNRYFVIPATTSSTTTASTRTSTDTSSNVKNGIGGDDARPAASPKFNPGCSGSCKTLECWQSKGRDKGSTVSNNVTLAQVIGWAKERLGMA